MERISIPLQVPTTDRVASSSPQPRPLHSASLHAVRKPAMKPVRRAPEPAQFKVYRVDAREFRHLVQRLTGAPHLSQAAQTPEATEQALAIDATPLTSLPPYQHTVQWQGGDMISIASAMQLNLPHPRVLQSVPSESSFYSNVSGANQLVSQFGGAVMSSRQAAAIVGGTGAAEFWLSALYPDNSTFWSSFPAIISPDAIASIGNTWYNDTTGIL